MYRSDFHLHIPILKDNILLKYLQPSQFLAISLPRSMPSEVVFLSTLRAFVCIVVIYFYPASAITFYSVESHCLALFRFAVLFLYSLISFLYSSPLAPEPNRILSSAVDIFFKFFILLPQFI